MPTYTFTDNASQELNDAPDYTETLIYTSDTEYLIFGGDLSVDLGSIICLVMEINEFFEQVSVLSCINFVTNNISFKYLRLLVTFVIDRFCAFFRLHLHTVLVCFMCS